MITPATDEMLEEAAKTEAAQDYASRRRRWEDSRVRQRSFCMKACSTGKENLATGQTYYKHIPCGDPLCPTCGPAIREEIQKALEQYSGQLRRVIVDSEEARAKIVRKYEGKDNVSCFPFEENGEIRYELLVKTQDEIGEKLEHITSSDLLRWSDKCFGHSKSGNLHKCQQEKPVTVGERPEKIDENVGEFEKQDIVVDLSDCKDDQGNTHTEEYWYSRIERETVENTAKLQPTTLEELEKALPIWRFERQRVIEKYGGVILYVYSMRITIRESQIDWSRRLRTFDSA